MDAVVLSEWLGAGALLSDDRRTFEAQMLLDKRSEIVVKDSIAVTTTAVLADILLNE